MFYFYFLHEVNIVNKSPGSQTTWDDEMMMMMMRCNFLLFFLTDQGLHDSTGFHEEAAQSINTVILSNNQALQFVINVSRFLPQDF